MSDGLEIRLRHIVVKDQQTGTADLHVGLRLYQVDAVNRGGRPLVKLSGDVFHCEVSAAFQGEGVHHGVGDCFSEDGIAAFVQQFGGEAAKVVHVEEAQGAYVQAEVLVKFVLETQGLNPEPFFLFDEYPVCVVVHRGG